VSVVALLSRRRQTFADQGTFGIAYTAGTTTTITGSGILHGFSAFQPVIANGSASFTNSVTIDGTAFTMGQVEYINRAFFTSFTIPATTTAWYTLFPSGIVSPIGKQSLNEQNLTGTTGHINGTLTRVAWGITPSSAGWSTSSIILNLSGQAGVLNSWSFAASSAGPDTSQYVLQLTIDGLANTIQLPGNSITNNSQPQSFSLVGMRYKTSVTAKVWAYRTNTFGYSLSATGQLFYSAGAIV
jgi:hypothetical protein